MVSLSSRLEALLDLEGNWKNDIESVSDNDLRTESCLSYSREILEDAPYPSALILSQRKKQNKQTTLIL